MSATSPRTIVGRRREDTALEPADLRDGDYWRTLESPWATIAERYAPTNLTGKAWRFYLDELEEIGSGLLVFHTVREHEDGTISVRAGDGSTNSIFQCLDRLRAWHGYVERGVFRGRVEERPGVREFLTGQA